MKLNRRIITVCLLLGLIGVWLIPLRVASAAIGQPDYDDLVASLEILSTSWDQTHAERANSILSKPQYTAADWQEFFAAYFGAHPFTTELRDYLYAPVFQSNEAAVRLNLQTGLIAPLEDKIQSIMAAHSDELSVALAADATLRQTLFNSHRFLNAYFHAGVIDLPERQGIADFYRAHIDAYPLWLKNAGHVDPTLWPYIATLRAQVAMNVADALPLSAARKTVVADILDLTGTYAAIWRDATVLVLDNAGLEQTQLDLIYRFLQDVPAGLYELRYITVNDLLGNMGEQYEPLTNDASMNIAGLPIGRETENAFPADVSPYLADVFTINIAHELNHQVDARLARSRPDLVQRRVHLLHDAGSICHNYLRSTFPDGYFVNTPQEFYANIANQWFADTQHTFDLALARWQAGYHEPLNQFLYFAQVYAQDENTVSFYRTDTQGQLARADVRVERDGGRAFITAIQTNKFYRFVIDDEGDVVEVRHFETYLPAVVR